MAPFKSKKHKMTKTDLARIFLSQISDQGYQAAQTRQLGGAAGPVIPEGSLTPQDGERTFRGLFGGRTSADMGDPITGAGWVQENIDALDAQRATERYAADLEASGDVGRYSPFQTDLMAGGTMSAEGQNGFAIPEGFDIVQDYDIDYYAGIEYRTPKAAAGRRAAAGAEQQRMRDEYLLGIGTTGIWDRFDQFGIDYEPSGPSAAGGREAAGREQARMRREWESGQQSGLWSTFDDIGLDYESRGPSKEKLREEQRRMAEQFATGRKYAPQQVRRSPLDREGGKGVQEGTQDFFQAFDDIVPGQLRGQLEKQQWGKTQRAEMGRVKQERIAQADTSRRSLRAADEKEWSAQFEFIKTQYSELGKKIRDAPNATQKLQLIQQRNDLIDEGKDLADKLGKEDIQEGKFPYVEPVKTGDIVKEGAKSATEDLDALQSTMGKGMGALGLKRGDVFRGTSYQSTGAINGVMKALAGIFILFIFIGVFYMVFGPIYDSLIFNFTNIVSADGDPTLGGKDIPTLFDNVAKVILVWVPLLVFAGALYKLTALVFEREVGTRTTEETEWDMLGALEDSTDLDMGSEPGVFEAYGGGY
tara:strand:+ start:877 stop:2643 length:1767 start_codon:yes stop_codon:yes gene_type:complete